MNDDAPGLPPELERQLDELALLDEAARTARLRELRERHPAHAVEIDVLARLYGEGVVPADRPISDGSGLVSLRGLPASGGRAAASGGSAGKYEIHDEIARGGIGVVLRGRDLDLGRGVAVKVLQDDFVRDEGVVRRFFEEAQIGGQLQHPGIVPVYDVGTHEGRPFFTMKLVRGSTLAQLLAEHDGGAAGQHRFLAVFEAVCQTLAYAHARGVIHRDLKPGNVMVGQFGEVQVVDWGMAKVLDRPRDGEASSESSVRTVRSADDSDGSRSIDGQVMGTPTYMPPEQARGEIDAIDERTDVFALGAMLCQILTGLPPYTGTGAESVMEAAKGNVAAAFERIRSCGADEELQQLAIDCLQPEQSLRPRTAKLVADRVGAYRAGVSQRAEDARVRAAAAQVRARATLLLSGAAVLVVLLVGGGWSYIESEAARRQAIANGLADDRMRDAVASLATARASGPARLELWQQAEALAVLAVEQAAVEDVDASRRARAQTSLANTREEYRAAQAEAERLAAERRMQARLEAVRIPADENFSVSQWEPLEARRLTAAYLAEFSDYRDGIDLRVAPPEVAAAALRGGIQLDLAIALDLWAVAGERATAENGGLEPAAIANLRRIAALLDPDDGWRSELRRLVAAGDDAQAALAQLAAEAPAKDLPAASTMLLVEVLAGAGQQEQAVAVCRAGCESHPGDFGLRMRLGILHAQRRQWLAAAGCFGIARALRPEMVEPLHLLGTALENGGQSQQSLEIFRGLLTETPDDPHWLYHLGMAHLGLEQHAAAAAAFDKGLRRAPSDGRMLLARAMAAEFVDGPEAAITRYRIAVNVYPSGSAWWALGRALLRIGRDQEAVPALEAAVAQGPPSSVWLESLLEAYSRTGRPRRLVEAVAAADRQRVDVTARSRCICGEALEELGESDAADRAYAAALALGTDDASAHFGLARVRHRNGQPEAALEHLRLAVQADPHHRLSLTALLKTLFGTGQQQEALARSRLLVKDPKVDRSVLVTIGAELNRADHPVDAEAAFRRVLELGTASARDHFNLGNALAAQQRMHGAAQQYREALRLDPTYLGAANNLASCLCDAGRLGAALAVADAAIARAPDATRLLSTRIQIRALAGMHDEARDDLAHLEDVIAVRQAAEPGWGPDVDVERSRRLIAQVQDARQAARQFVFGERSDPGPEGLAFAAKFASSLGMHRRAVELFEQATAAADSVGIDPFDAGCAALLAAAHDAGLTDEQRARLRQQALGWLRAALSATTATGPSRRDAWLESGDLDPVRGPRLAALPEAERAQWSALWRDVDARVGGR